MKPSTKKSKLAMAVAGAIAAGGAFSVQAATSTANPFAANKLSGGYMQLAEANCGEGKCGGKKAKGADGEAKCGGDKKTDHSCGGDKKAAAGGDKKTDGSCGEGKCGGDKKAAAGGDKKTDGSCGEGKCGGKK